jgi:hypothetical protein
MGKEEIARQMHKHHSGIALCRGAVGAGTLTATTDNFVLRLSTFRCSPFLCVRAAAGYAALECRPLRLKRWIDLRVVCFAHAGVTAGREAFIVRRKELQIRQAKLMNNKCTGSSKNT